MTRFVRSQLHVLRERPRLVYQQALNQPDATDAARAARKMAGAMPPHVRLLTKEQAVSPVLMELKGHEGAAQCCAVSRDGKWVFSVSAKEAMAWDAATGAEVLFLPAVGEDFTTLALGAGGFFALGSSAGHCYMAIAEGLSA